MIASQVLPVLHHRCLPHDPLHRGPLLADSGTTTPSGHCYDWRLYTLRALAHGAHHCRYRALRADGVGVECLRYGGVQPEPEGADSRGAGISAAEEYLYVFR